MNENNKKLETKRIILYLGITFALTIAYSFGIIYPFYRKAETDLLFASLVQLVVAGVMFCPSIGVLLTRLITKEGLQNAWLHPHIKGNIKTYLLAYFGPGILTIVGAAIYFLVFPDAFDPNMGYFVYALESSGAGIETLPISLNVLVAIQFVQGFLLAPILNFVTCFGEEWGWRGYLLPKMAKKLPMLPMLLVTGIIWGLWHAPLTAIGHNYGLGYPGFPFTGIATMCLFCTVLGIFLSYITLKTKSCIPAVIAHGAVNGIAAIGTLFTKDGGNPFIGPAPSGVVGMIPFMIVAVLMIVFYFRKQKEI